MIFNSLGDQTFFINVFRFFWFCIMVLIQRGCNFHIRKYRIQNMSFCVLSLDFGFWIEDKLLSLCLLCSEVLPRLRLSVDRALTVF